MLLDKAMNGWLVGKPSLVGGLEHGFYDFPCIGNIIIPTDELIFFRGLAQPPTRSEPQFIQCWALDLPRIGSFAATTDNNVL